MREIDDVVPAPTTELEILRHGIAEIAMATSGFHQDPENVCYGVKREYSGYAVRIKTAARAAAQKEQKAVDA